MKKVNFFNIGKYLSITYVVVFLFIFLMSFVVEIKSNKVILTSFESKVFFITFIICLIRTLLAFAGKRKTKNVRYIRRNDNE